MSKDLLREYFELCPEGRCPVERLTEAEKRNISNGGVYLVGICQKAGTKNGNGRVYRKETLQREVENYQKAIGERRSLGGLGSGNERNGETIVEDDFQLICFDMVSEPSTPNAFLSPQRGASSTSVSVTMPETISNYISEGKKTNKVDSLIDSILRD